MCEFLVTKFAVINDQTYQQLVRGLQRGDEKALEKIYDAYGHALYGQIIRIVGSEEVAQEILQDTFTKVWTHRMSYDGRQGRLYTWMMRIARNASLNYLESKHGKRRYEIQSDTDLVYIGDNKLEKSMESLDLRGAVNDLDPKYREVLHMIYYQGYTHVQVSEELDLPLGTVKSRIKIGIRELKKLYQYNLSSVLAGIIALLLMA